MPRWSFLVCLLALAVGVRGVSSPEVAKISPPDGTTDAAETVRYTIEFTAEMNPFAVQKNIQLIDDTTAQKVEVDFMWMRHRTALLLSPAQPLTPAHTYTLTIHPGARSAAGFPLVETFTSKVAIGAETPAHILSITPSDHAVRAAVDSDVRVTFSQAMDTEGTQMKLEMQDKGKFVIVPGEVLWEEENTEMLFVPEGDLKPFSGYRITVGDADSDGPIDYEVTHCFETGDHVAPAVGGIIPSADSRADTDSTVTVIFNKPINQVFAEGGFHLYLYSPKDQTRAGEDVKGRFHWDGDETMIFVPTKALDPREHYQVRLDSFIIDQDHGNPMNDEFLSEFKTRAHVPPSLDSVHPKADSTNLHINEPFKVTFGVAMDRQSVTQGMHIKCGAHTYPCSYHFSVDERQITCKPKKGTYMPANSKCSLLVANVHSKAGLPLDQFHKFDYQTGKSVLLATTCECKNGKCVGNKCECAQGWTGTKCDQREDECTANGLPCQNGICQFGTCQCVEGWVGVQCQKMETPDQLTVAGMAMIGSQPLPDVLNEPSKYYRYTTSLLGVALLVNVVLICGGAMAQILPTKRGMAAMKHNSWRGWEMIDFLQVAVLAMSVNIGTDPNVLRRDNNELVRAFDVLNMQIPMPEAISLTKGLGLVLSEGNKVALVALVVFTIVLLTVMCVTPLVWGLLHLLKPVSPALRNFFPGSTCVSLPLLMVQAIIRTLLVGTVGLTVACWTHVTQQLQADWVSVAAVATILSLSLGMPYVLLLAGYFLRPSNPHQNKWEFSFGAIFATYRKSIARYWAVLYFIKRVLFASLWGAFAPAAGQDNLVMHLGVLTAVEALYLALFIVRKPNATHRQFFGHAAMSAAETTLIGLTCVHAATGVDAVFYMRLGVLALTGVSCLFSATIVAVGAACGFHGNGALGYKAAPQKIENPEEAYAGAYVDRHVDSLPKDMDDWGGFDRVELRNADDHIAYDDVDGSSISDFTESDDQQLSDNDSYFSEEEHLVDDDEGINGHDDLDDLDEAGFGTPSQNGPVVPDM